MNTIRKSILYALSLPLLIASSSLCMDIDKKRKISQDFYTLEFRHNNNTIEIQKHRESAQKIITSAFISNTKTNEKWTCILPTPYRRFPIYADTYSNFSQDGSKFICAQYDETEETLYIPPLIVSVLDLRNKTKSEWKLTYQKRPNFIEGIVKKIAISSDGKRCARLIESLSIPQDYESTIPLLLITVNEFESPEKECHFEIKETFGATDLAFTEGETSIAVRNTYGVVKVFPIENSWIMH